MSQGKIIKVSGPLIVAEGMADVQMYDVVRIDHFRGFEKFYSIPAKDETAENGKWKKGPGIDLFNAIKAELGDVKIIAEDLGTITPGVKKLLDETGYLEDEEIRLQDDVRLTQADIRAVQLAKAATHAGIMSLLAAAKCSPAEIEKVFLAGGFGSHLNLRSAARIGLIPAELADKVQVIGNAALDGAAMLLLNTRLRSRTAAIRQVTEHVRLDGNPDFVQRYVDAMMFEE